MNQTLTPTSQPTMPHPGTLVDLTPHPVMASPTDNLPDPSIDDDHMWFAPLDEG